MHIPDGLLDLKTLGTTATLSTVSLGTALRRLRLGMPRRRIPLMGLTAAFLFTAQMLNFPVAGGTSGHLIGAVLAAVLLGPSAAIVAVTAVLLVQCLLFADGGLLALGANVFNMAIVAVVGGHFVFRAIFKLLGDRKGLLVATAFASWFSTVLASIVCAAELAWSSVARFGLVFPVMASVHMLIGFGEALITTLVVAAILKTRPDLNEAAQAKVVAPSRVVTAFSTAAVFGLLLFAIPFASSWPDGLERALEVLGFKDRASPAALVPSPLANYRIPGVSSAAGAACAAGLIGTLVAFAFAIVLGSALAPKAVQDAAPGGGA